MSATSFGGSFGLVKSNDATLKNLFMDRLKRTAVFTQLPILKYIPFIPAFDPRLDELIAGIISKRRAEKERKKDLLQILIDTNTENPENFTEAHMYDEMRLFMYVIIILIE